MRHPHHRALMSMKSQIAGLGFPQDSDLQGCSIHDSSLQDLRIVEERSCCHFNLLTAELIHVDSLLC